MSILSFLVKYFKNLPTHIIILDFIKKNNLLYKNQFGFRPKHSTHHALVTLVAEISKTLDKGVVMTGVFFDLCKALDTVIHNILLRKLYAYEIRGSMHLWMKNYLMGRK